MQVKGVIVAADVRSTAHPRPPGWSSAVEHVANQPIIHHVLESLVSAGIGEIVVVSPSGGAAAIRSCLESGSEVGRNGPRGGPAISYLDQPAPLTFGDALRLAAPLVGDATCLVHLAGGLLEQPLRPLLSRVGRDAPDLIVTVHQANDPAWHLNSPTQAMLHLAELHPERAPLSMAGVCVFGPGAMRHASHAAWRSRGGGEVDLTAAARRIAREGGNFEVLPVSAWHRYAGDPLDLLELNRIALDRMGHDLKPSTREGSMIEGRVFIHERASVQTSVIVGPTAIGPEAQISDSYIGPYTSIGAAVRIEGAEIERSIVAAGASIMHVGSRVVSSVIGRDARVFRDFSLPRAFRLRIGAGTEIALC